MPDCQAWGHPSTSADRLYYIPNQRLKKQKNQLDACVLCLRRHGWALSGMLRWLLCLDEKFIFVTS